MAVNKVVYAGNTLIDLSGDTITPEDLAKGVTAHDKSGKKITGTMQGSNNASLPDGVSALACGTLTPTSDITSSVRITHELGVRPNFYIVRLKDESFVNAIDNTLLNNGVISNEFGFAALALGAYYTYKSGSVVQGGIMDMTESIFTNSDFKITGVGSSSILKAGCTYTWLCGVIN